MYVSPSLSILVETPRTAGNVWTPGCVSVTGSDSSVEDLRDALTSNDSAVECFNEAMAKIAELTTGPSTSTIADPNENALGRGYSRREK